VVARTAIKLWNRLCIAGVPQARSLLFTNGNNALTQVKMPDLILFRFPLNGGQAARFHKAGTEAE
jgi:hypothetical protein